MTISEIDKRENAMSGVDKFHKLGYEGQGINVMSLEAISDHSQGVENEFYEVAPKAKIYRVGAHIRSDNEAVYENYCTYEGKTYGIEEFIFKFNIKIITKSTGGKPVDKVMSAYWKRLIDKYGLILVGCAGNEGTKGITTPFPTDVSIVVGAVGLSDKGKIVVKNYTGQDKEVDFAYFTGDKEGTSFSTPKLCGVMCLLLNYHGYLNMAEMHSILAALSVDVGAPGEDDRTGHGVPFLK